ncbi:MULTISPECIES: hypothetical protein [Thermodesulfovibrio]|jgi:hypothetical protein|uniref:hypothetical protein n=1 Tax=Thermodesulfovibrio TaxID=28261 RepID=UPI0026185E67|nr:hypothetical protein [Thermodesulfovibrio sp.]
MVIFGIEKLSRMVKLSRKTLLKYHKKNGLPIRKLGKRWVTTKELALEWFKENLELYTNALEHSRLIKEGKRFKDT